MLKYKWYFQWWKTNIYIYIWRWLVIYEDDKLYRKLRKMFLSPRRESNPQPSNLWRDAPTIEPPGLRWQREGHNVYQFVCTTHVLLIQQSWYVSIHVYINKYIDILTYRDCCISSTCVIGCSAIRVLVARWWSVSPEVRRLRVRFPSGAQKYFSELAKKAWISKQFSYGKQVLMFWANVLCQRERPLLETSDLAFWCRQYMYTNLL